MNQDKRKHLTTMWWLLAASTVGLTLGIVLPITIRNKDSHQNYIQYPGLSKITNYNVGQPINLKLNLTNFPIHNLQNCQFRWYEKTTNHQSKLLSQETNLTSIQITNPSIQMDHSIVYCVITETLGNSTFSTSNKSSIKEYYTETQLHLANAFVIQNCQISCQNTSANLILDQSEGVILSSQSNQSVTLNAKVDTPTVYQNFVHYQWFKNGKAIDMATDSSYVINQLQTGDEYYCQVQLIDGASSSSVLKSKVMKVNVVKSLQLSNQPITVTVNGKSEAANNYIPVNSSVELTAEFKLGNIAINPNSSDYSINYTWYHNDQLISDVSSNILSLNQIKNNQAGNYSCKLCLHFKNGGSLTLTSYVELKLSHPKTIIISSHLPNLTVYNGSNINLNLNANLDDTSQGLEYQWFVQLPKTNTWKPLGSKSSSSTLSLNQKETLSYNGAQFKCEVSCNNPSVQAKTVISNTMTLTVINPEFNVSLTTNQTGTIYCGGSIQLTAITQLVKNSDISTQSISPEFGYQWYKSTDNGQNWTKLNTATQSSLNLSPLTQQENHNQFKCLIYPKNAIASSGESTEQLGKYTKPFTLNLSEFNLEGKIQVSSGDETNYTDSITNNLGDSFTLKINSNLENNNVLPTSQGYSYQYVWQASDTNEPTSIWTALPSQSDSDNQGLYITTANQAGLHYYRCAINIYKNSNTEQSHTLVQTFYTSTVTVNTYPGVTISPNNSHFNLPYHATITLKPNIALINSLQKVFSDESTSNADLSHYSPVYQWSFNGHLLTSQTVKNYPFLEASDINSPTLTINDFKADNSTDCNGSYSLSVTINHKTYTMTKPFIVTVQNPTFTVTAEATGNLGAQVMNLSATINQINKTQEDSNYTYTWYVTQKSANAPLQKIGSTTSSNFAYTSWTKIWKNGINSSWNNKLEFYCQVTNNTTGEVEWTYDPAPLQVVSPTLSCVLNNGKDSITLAKEGDPVVINAVAQPSFTVGNNKKVIFLWEMSPSADNDKWISLSSNRLPPELQIQDSGFNSTLILKNATSLGSGLKFRCIACYNATANLCVKQESNIITIIIAK